MDVSPDEKSMMYLWKVLILKLNFQGEGRFYANFLFSIIIV